MLLPEDEPHRDLKRTGQPLPSTWRQAYLEHYAQHGTHWKACKYAGVSHMTAERHRAADAEFARQCEDARQEFADSREVNLATLADKGNVVGDIVLLKRHRAELYIEKNLSITANFSAELDPHQGQQLLAAMLQTMSPTSVQALQAAPRVLDASPAAEATRRAGEEGAGA